MGPFFCTYPHILLGTKNLGLILGGQVIPKIFALSDANFANDPNDRKSITGYVSFLGNSPVSWAAASSV